MRHKQPIQLFVGTVDNMLAWSGLLDKAWNSANTYRPSQVLGCSVFTKELLLSINLQSTCTTIYYTLTTNLAAVSHVPTEILVKALAYMITVHIRIMTNVYTNPGSTLALCFCPEIDWWALSVNAVPTACSLKHTDRQTTNIDNVQTTHSHYTTHVQLWIHK